MPRKNSAVEALRKLEADREALAAKQQELEKEAALELGQVILGSGLESFSTKGLRRVAKELGAMGEPLDRPPPIARRHNSRRRGPAGFRQSLFEVR